MAIPAVYLCVAKNIFAELHQLKNEAKKFAEATQPMG
jgi:hypothetical protein